MKRKFRASRGATLFTLAAVAVLLALGTWQVQRLGWKTELIARIEARMAEKPVPLPEQIDDPAAWEYRRVTMAGRFLHDREFLVGPRTMEGRAGYHMVTPFRRASGGVVFVNRGWVPDEQLKGASRPSGIVRVEGIVQFPRKYRFTPDNVPQKDLWYWTDVAEMARAAKLDNVLPVTVSVAARQKGVYPAGGQLRLDIPNDHGQYAAFWYFMALALGIIYVVFYWREEDAGV